MRPDELPETALEFLREYHLASLTTLRADGSPHVVPVGFSWDPEAGLVRINPRAGRPTGRNVSGCGRAPGRHVAGGRGGDRARPLTGAQ